MSRTETHPTTTIPNSYHYDTDDSHDDDDPIKFLENEYDSLSAEAKMHIRKELYGGSNEITTRDSSCCSRTSFVTPPEEDAVETPEFLDQKIMELTMEINKLSKDITKSYFLALQQEKEQEAKRIERKQPTGCEMEAKNDCYVRSTHFQAMFLRAENYQATFAARRMTKYFNEKLKLFPHLSQQLHKKIHQSDLSALDLQALYLGGHVLMGNKDKWGRHIFLVNRQRALCHKIINVQRAVFYLVSSVLLDNTNTEDDEESHKKGIVTIVTQNQKQRSQQNQNHTRFSSSIADFFSQKVNLMKLSPLMRMVTCALPIRLCALHNFYNNTKEHQLLSFLLRCSPKKKRPNMLLHYCLSQKECKQILTKYGVDYDSLPLVNNNNVTNETTSNRDSIFQYDIIQQHLEQKRIEEEQEENVQR